mgnify:FL=1
MTRYIAAVPLIFAAVAVAGEAPVPIEEEPRHRLVFENRYVRHFDVQLEPGYVARYHWHRNDGVFVNIRSANTTAQDWGGEPVQRGWRAVGEAYFIGYTEKPKAHRVSNTDARLYHVTDTEVLQGCGPAPALPARVRNQSLIVENSRVQVMRIVLHPGESTDLAGPCGMLVSLYPATLRLGHAGGGDPLVLPRAGFRWRETRETQSLVNAGKTVFHGVDIRLK